MIDQFDFIIVGVGFVGCVLVDCFLEDLCNCVFVLEFGGMDVGFFIQMLVVFFYLMNMVFYDWGYQSELELYLGGCRFVILCGKVIGGFFLINGMVYVCGYVCDFDIWEDMGVSGWGYCYVLFYYKCMEMSYGGQDGWCGIDGLMKV